MTDYNIDELKDLPPEEILEKLVYFKKKYYAGEPVISDSKYDELEDYFRSEYPELSDQLPVGVTLDEFEKVEHPTFMGSLPKIDSESQVADWENEHGDEGNIIYQPKFDGIAIELIYEDGELEYMLSRGDGEEGENVTHVARVLDSVPNVVPAFEDIGRVILRGEAVLYKEDHPNEARRNLAAGTLKSLDSTVALERNLQVYVHTIHELSGHFDGSHYEERLEFLEDSGFQVTPMWHELEDYEEPWFDVPYDVDGVVIKTVNHNEHSAIAFKFPEETAYTEVRDVSYELGRTKKITPVLKVEPVIIDNRELENVSLGSYQILKDAEIGPGDTVEVAFANDVIPHMESVVERTDSERFSLDECPVCGTEVEMDGSHLYCTNDDCGDYRERRFKAMLGSLGIDGLGGKKKTQLGELYNWDFEDLIREWDRHGEVPSKVRALNGWGSKTAESIWKQAVEAVHDLTWYRLYKVLSLDAFGKKTREKFLRENKDDPYPLTTKKLLQTPGIQSTTAEKVMESFNERRHVAEALIGLSIGEIGLGVMTEEEMSGGPLEGVKVFVTGGLNNFSNRGEFKEFVRAHGGEWGKSQDSILVTNDPESTSSKAKYARNNNLPIMTEREFLEDHGLLEEVLGSTQEEASLEEFA